MSKAWLGQAFEHEADHGETDESSDGRVIAFEVAHHTAIAADPGECPLDDPSLWQNDKAVEIRSLDNFEVPRACRGGNLCHFRPASAKIRSMKGKRRRARCNRSRAPSRS